MRQGVGTLLVRQFQSASRMKTRSSRRRSWSRRAQSDWEAALAGSRQAASATGGRVAPGASPDWASKRAFQRGAQNGRNGARPSCGPAAAAAPPAPPRRSAQSPGGSFARSPSRAAISARTAPSCCMARRPSSTCASRSTASTVATLAATTISDIIRFSRRARATTGSGGSPPSTATRR